MKRFDVLHQFTAPRSSVQIRQARSTDIARMHRIRLSAHENTVTRAPPTAEDYRQAILDTGRGWVAETPTGICGFVIGNREDGNIWALFVDPRYQGRGIGRMLHDSVVGWLLEQGCKRLWLRTLRGTRAEHFLREAGWRGAEKGSETLFELFPSSIEQRYEAY